MCTALAQWLVDRTEGHLAVAAIGSPTGDALLRDLTPGERYASVHVVDGTGRRFSGGAAVPLVLAELPYGGPVAWLARRLPSATELGYGVVARHRRTISRLLRISRGARRASGRPRA